MLVITEKPSKEGLDAVFRCLNNNGFSQIDPIGCAEELNLYGYVGNDPINWVDPSGLEDQPSGGVVVTACPTGYFKQPERDGGGNLKCIPLPSSITGDRGAVGSGGGGGGGSGKRDKPQPPVCPVVPVSRPVGDTTQLGAAINDPLGAPAAYGAADAARESSAKQFPSMSGNNDIRDAYRHFYWVSGMTRLMGASRAMAFANSHEANYPLKNQQDARSRQMDTFNNYVAAKMTNDPRFKGVSSDDLAKLALKNGCLDTGK